MVREVQ
jgi:hypothetical protein